MMRWPSLFIIGRIKTSFSIVSLHYAATFCRHLVSCILHLEKWINAKTVSTTYNAPDKTHSDPSTSPTYRKRKINEMKIDQNESTNSIKFEDWALKIQKCRLSNEIFESIFLKMIYFSFLKLSLQCEGLATQ